MTCKTCKYLDLPLNKNGKRYATKDGMYRCNAMVPNDWWIMLPHSVLRSYGFSQELRKGVMAPSDGQGCPCYEEHKV